MAEAANHRTSPSQSYIEGALYTGYPPFCENPNLPVNNVPVLRQAMALTIGQLATLSGVPEGQPTAVAIVSCATFTSGSFTTSLQQALLKAGEKAWDDLRQRADARAAFGKTEDIVTEVRTRAEQTVADLRKSVGI